MAKLTSYGRQMKEEHPDKYNKMVEAMNKSNGKVNNLLGMMLAMSDTTTSDDVVALASGIGATKEELSKLQPIVGYSYDNKMWDVISGRTKDEILRERKNLRQQRFQRGFEYKFEDTFLYRIMQKIGLQSKLEGEKEYWGSNTYSVQPTHYKKLMDSNYVQPVMMFYHASEDLRTLILNDENLNKMWTEQAKIQRTIYKPYNEKEKAQHPISSTDEEWRKFQTTHIIKEFDQIAHMPMKLKEKMNGWIDHYENKPQHWGEEKLPPIVMHTILEGFRYPGEDKTIELIREAFEVMDYMGIGVCWNFVDNEVFETNPDGSIQYDENGKEVKKIVYRRAYYKEMSYRVGAMLKHVSSSMRKFAADIKKGFDPRDVRELVVEDLNGWCEAQARGHWQFFERDDAPTDYPDLQKKKKSKKVVNKESEEIELEIMEDLNNNKENENDTKSES